MKILGIESSCDETAAAVVEDGRRLLSNVVHSQIDIHAAYGGVIPEVAARSHLEAINPVIDRALAEADCSWDDIDAIAVTYAPGLVGSLLVGTLAARTLAVLHDKPLYPIHHVEAHVYANFITEQGSALAHHSDHSSHPRSPQTDSGSWLAAAGKAEGSMSGRSDELEGDTVQKNSTPGTALARVAASGAAPENRFTESKTFSGADSPTGPESSDRKKLTLPSSQPQFPMLALIVSGGHSQLVLFKNHGDYELLGQTQDDAVGEAFDKVAKILGLPYPGGPSIAEAATRGDAHRYQLPKARLENPFDFSFSGLKTAVLRAVQRETGHDFTFPSHQLAPLLSEQQRVDFAASFQHVAVETLVDKAEKAFYRYNPQSVVIAGGVAANQALRQELGTRLPLDINYAPPSLCTDNAAMIATLGYFYQHAMPPGDPYALEVVPSLSMTQTARAEATKS